MRCQKYNILQAEVPEESFKRVEITPPNDCCDDMRGDYAWQDAAATTLSQHRVSRLVAPTGSGKTAIIQAAAWTLRQSGKRTLIITPQQMLAKAYKKINIKRNNGDLYKGEINQVFDSDKDNYMEGSYMEGSSVRRMLMWLRQKNPSIACTTNSTFVLAWNKLTEDERLQAIRHGLWLFADECHHLAYHEEEGENTFVTQMGDIGAWIIKNGGAFSSISATPFRGDGAGIWSLETQKIFDEDKDISYERSFIDHWKFLRLRGLNYLCVEYNKDPISDVCSNILREPRERHIICVRADGQGYRKDPQWLARLLNELRSKGLNVLDLVNMEPKTRKNSKKQLRDDNDEYKKTGKSQYDVIVACNIMREGNDWVPASRVHDLAPSESALRTIQTIGRMTRRDRWGNKRDISYAAYFDQLSVDAEPETLRKLISDRINSGLLCLLSARDYFSPVRPICANGQQHSVSEVLERAKSIFKDKKKAIMEQFTVNVVEALRQSPTGSLTDLDRASCIAKTLSGWNGKDHDKAFQCLCDYSRVIETLPGEKVDSASPAIADEHQAEDTKLRTKPPLRKVAQNAEMLDLIRQKFDIVHPLAFLVGFGAEDVRTPHFQELLGVAFPGNNARQVAVYQQRFHTRESETGRRGLKALQRKGAKGGYVSPVVNTGAEKPLGVAREY